jgi:hypothetical protein
MSCSFYPLSIFLCLLTLLIFPEQALFSSYYFSTVAVVVPNEQKLLSLHAVTGHYF